MGGDCQRRSRYKKSIFVEQLPSDVRLGRHSGGGKGERRLPFPTCRQVAGGTWNRTCAQRWIGPGVLVARRSAEYLRRSEGWLRVSGNRRRTESQWSDDRW